MSVDPLTNQYPFYSPYHFASNYPILAVDVDGLESDYLLHLQERFIEGMFGDKANTPIGQSNVVTNTFVQKNNLVNPRDIARQFYNDPVGTGQKIIGGIKKGVRETKEDLLSGDPERMAHAAGRVTGIVAETIAPVPVIGKIFKIKISPKLKVPSGNVSNNLKRNFSVEDLNVNLKGMQKGRLDAGKVERFKMLMQNDMFDFTSKKGKIGVSIDKKGTVHVGEGHHRIGAAIEIFEETGNVGPLEKLLNNAKQTFVDSPPANSTSLPKK